MKLSKNGGKCMKVSELGADPAAVEGVSCLGLVHTHLISLCHCLPYFIDEDTDFVGIVRKNRSGSRYGLESSL